MASSENEFDLAISYDLELVFVWLTTGFGKSICYRYTTLPFVFDHKLGRVDRDYHSLVVVVSPLISLMIDQVASLMAIESSASIATSGGSVSKALLATEEGLVNCSLLYCAPEALVSREMHSRNLPSPRGLSLWLWMRPTVSLNGK